MNIFSVVIIIITVLLLLLLSVIGISVISIHIYAVFHFFILKFLNNLAENCLKFSKFERNIRQICFAP